MDKQSSASRTSLKKDMIHLLDQFLLGFVSPKELKNAVVPMLMVSSHKKGRKSYIEKYLLDISAKDDSELTRDYVYDVREFISGETISSGKDRKRVLRRSLRKLVERYLFDEIDGPYFISSLADLAVEYNNELEPEMQKLIEDVHGYSQFLRESQQNGSDPPNEEQLVERVNGFYETYFKGLWDE